MRVHRIFFRVYVNDIIVFNQILEKHISHLHSVFQLLDSYRINLSFKESFLHYPILETKIEIFGFITAAEKLEIISKLIFFFQKFGNIFEIDRLIAWFRILVYAKN